MTMSVTAQPIHAHTSLRGAHRLRQIYLFSHLSPEDFHKIMGSMQTHHLDKNQVLFHQGEKANRFFFIRKGQIKLFLLSAKGGEKIIHIEHSDHTFAEALMFRDKPVYPVSAEAVQTSVVLSFASKVFTDILRHNTETCFRLMATMSQRLHWQLGEIENLCLHNATYRLVAYLLREVPTETDHNASIHLAISKATLASRLSIKSETLSRILSQLRRQHLIDVQGHDIILRDIQGLRQLLA